MISRFLVRYLLKKNFQISILEKFLFKWIKKLEIRKIVWLDTLNHSKLVELKKATLTLSYSPKIFDNSILALEVSLPALNLYCFKNVVVNSCSSNFIPKNGKEVIFERVPDANLKYCNYTTGIIRYHNETAALFRYKKSITHKKYYHKALYLGGNGVFNYYHWLIEISPKLLFITPRLLKSYDINTLILDESVQNIPSFFDILKLFLSVNSLNINIVYQNKNKDLHIKQLFYINNLNNVVFNSRQVLSSPTYSHYCPELISKIRSVCLGQLALTTPKNNHLRKIFLARSNCSARSYNQDEVLSCFEKLGFTPIYLENFVFIEQVRIFNQADIIVGPSGAAWANIIFCRPTIKAISWLPTQIAQFSVFSSLAHIVDCDLKFALTQPDNPEDIHSSYRVNASDLIALYEMMNTTPA